MAASAEENPLVAYRSVQHQPMTQNAKGDRDEAPTGDDFLDVPMEEALNYLEGVVGEGWVDAASRIETPQLAPPESE